MKHLKIGMLALLIAGVFGYGAVSTIRINRLEQRVLDLQNAQNADAGGMAALAEAYQTQAQRTTTLHDLKAMAVVLGSHPVAY